MTDADVRREIYDLTIRNGTIPPSQSFDGDALRRLAEQRIIVLGANGEIRMAAPFSGVPTPFVVRAGNRSYYANCIWDALGISPMLQIDSTIETSCPDCEEPLEVAVRGGELIGGGIVHFSVPAREWWNDIVYT
jgi:hypothetical protein